MKRISKTNFRVVVEPRRLGDFGGIRVADNFGGFSQEQVERDYHKRCEEIVADIKRHADNVDHCQIEWDTEVTCSHCGRDWEECDVDDDPDLPKGIPLCCNHAMEEWRKAQALKALRA